MESITLIDPVLRSVKASISRDVESGQCILSASWHPLLPHAHAVTLLRNFPADRNQEPR